MADMGPAILDMFDMLVSVLDMLGKLLAMWPPDMPAELVIGPMDVTMGFMLGPPILFMLLMSLREIPCTWLPLDMLGGGGKECPTGILLLLLALLIRLGDMLLCC